MFKQERRQKMAARNGLEIPLTDSRLAARFFALLVLAKRQLRRRRPCRAGPSHVTKCLQSEHASARRAPDEALLQQVGLDDLLERIAWLGKRRGECLDADRTSVIIPGNAAEIAVIERVETGVVDLESTQRLVRCLG